VHELHPQFGKDNMRPQRAQPFDPFGAELSIGKARVTCPAAVQHRPHPLNDELLMVAGEHDRRDRHRQVEAFGWLAAPGGEIAQAPHLLDPSALDIRGHGTKRRKVRVDVGEDGNSHLLIPSLKPRRRTRPVRRLPHSSTGSRPTALRRSSALGRVYARVVSSRACPSSSAAITRSVPPRTSVVANECRSTWALT